MLSSAGVGVSDIEFHSRKLALELGNDILTRLRARQILSIQVHRSCGIRFQLRPEILENLVLTVGVACDPPWLTGLRIGRRTWICLEYRIFRLRDRARGNILVSTYRPQFLW